MINKDKLQATGSVNIVVRGEDGNVTQDFTIPNLVVDTGLDYIASRMKDATATAMTHMAVGSGTTVAAAGQTALVTEVARVALTSSTVTGESIAYVASYAAGTGTGALTEAAILNAASAGTMLCRTVFSVINKGAGDTMTVTWTITIS
jgi:hypothetical protein|tara:strand:- start:576 stop:1019 length:444 start_codon:yes stop_codon:yes gene_type:complete